MSLLARSGLIKSRLRGNVVIVLKFEAHRQKNLLYGVDNNNAMFGISYAPLLNLNVESFSVLFGYKNNKKRNKKKY
jgi:hypothetical protein